VPSLLGAVLLWDFFIRVMQGVTTTFFEDVWSRNFLNVFATPLSISEYVGGLVLSSIATSSVGLVVMLVLPPPSLACRFFVYGALLIPITGAVSVRNCTGRDRLRDRSAAWTGGRVVHLADSGADFAAGRRFYPLSTLPAWMRFLSRLLPPSYVFESMRSIVLKRPGSPAPLFWGAALDVVFLLLASWFFRSIYHHAVRTGLIARYSAES